MDIIQAIILGIVEGLTEFLPVSSTGHLIVVTQWLGMEQDEINTSFQIIIQLAAILAVVANYKEKFTLKHIDLWLKVTLAFIPIAAIGFLFSDQIKAIFSVNVVATMFIVGGVIFLVLEYFYKESSAHTEDVEDISYKQAAIIGFAQIFALIPGTSRAGSTIVGALLVGLDRKTSAEFSFLLAFPVMLATCGYELLKYYKDFSLDNIIVLAVGFVTSFIVAYFVMKLFIQFLARFTFVAFGVYRILFGLLLFALAAI